MSRGTVSLKEALLISRPLWWVTTSVPFIVGSLLATGNLTFTILVGAIYFLIPYNLMMYGVNDIFDYESDMRNERKNTASVLPKVKHASLIRWIIWLNLPFVLYFLLAGNIESTFFLFMMIYLVLAYSVQGLRFKEMPFIDSLTSGFHYAAPFLFGLFLFESPDLWAPAFTAFYFWAVGNHAYGAIQDISPDKASGTKSIATVLGPGKTIIFSLCAYALAVLAAVLGYGVWGAISAALIAPYFLTVATTYRYRKHENSPRFRRAWDRFVRLNYIVGAIGSVVLLYLYNR